MQLYAALLFNANIKGFASGRIYQGPLKGLCAPGLNCYSCPGATSACPLGSIQNSLSSGKSTAFYIFGIIILYGVLLGRWICGFLCPFGLIQELIYKINTPKIKKSAFTRALSYLKYVILVLLVFVIPLIYAEKLPLPAFCKYVCPAGTLEGAIGLLANSLNEGMFAMLGPLFTWKFVLLAVFIAGSVFFYRFFCRFFCPLGAIYGLFNRFSLIGIDVKQEKCTNCGLCTGKCKMDIRRVGDAECISCGECIPVCPTKAIVRRGPKFIIGDPSSEIGPVQGRSGGKAPVKVRSIVTLVLLAAVLTGTLVYFNACDTTEAPIAQPDVGNEIGDLCPTLDLPLYSGGVFNTEQSRGKITVINFWGTWCGPCVAELPHFSSLAGELGERAVFVAVHTNSGKDTAYSFIEEGYKDSEMLFVHDLEGEAYYNALGGRGSYPTTIILDENGVIAYIRIGSLTENELKAAVDAVMNGTE